MDHAGIRNNSLAQLKALGYSGPMPLPVLDEEILVRSNLDVRSRILSLNLVTSCAYGFAKDKGLQWLGTNQLMAALTDSELAFLNSDQEGKGTIFQYGVYSLWTLAWAAGWSPDSEVLGPISNDFVHWFPDLKTNETAEKAKPVQLRSPQEIIQQVDLLYCTHWVIRDSQISSSPNTLGMNIYEIRERRRSLEWLISEEDWENVPLDT